MILPQMEQHNTYQLFNSALPLTDPTNAAFLRVQIKAYKCPSDPKPDYFQLNQEGSNAVIAELPTVNYLGVFGPENLDDCENSPVHFISENIDGGVYRSLATIQGGEVVGEF